MSKQAWIPVLVAAIFALIVAGCGGNDNNDTEEVALPTQVTPPPTVTLTGTPLSNDAAQIGKGVLVGGEITPGDIPQRWVYDATPGEVVRLQIARLDESLNLQVQLIDPDGALVNQFGTGDEDQSLSAPIPLDKAGMYVIQATGGGSSGSYSIAVLDNAAVEAANANPTATATAAASNPPPEPPTATATLTPIPTDIPPTLTPTMVITATFEPPGGRLQPDSTRRSEITLSGETHRYTFFANSGDVLSVGVNVDPDGSGTLNPYIELQAPNGEIVAQDDDMLPGVADALIRNYEVPTTGVYTVYVKSADEAGTGRYYISLSTGFTLRDVHRGEALKDQPNAERLDTYGARDVWLIQLQAGDVVSVVVEANDPASGLDVMTELVAPDGESLAFDDNSGGNGNAVLNEIQVPSDGVYVINVAARNNASIGAYTLWWQNLKDYPTPTPVTPTATTFPTLTPPQDSIQSSVEFGGVFTYQIAAAALQTVNIAVIGQAGFDPVLQVFDPAGNIVIVVDDVTGSQDPRASFTAGPSGLYTIEVSGFEGAAGNFTLNYIVQ